MDFFSEFPTSSTRILTQKKTTTSQQRTKIQRNFLEPPRPQSVPFTPLISWARRLSDPMGVSKMFDATSWKENIPKKNMIENMS